MSYDMSGQGGQQQQLMQNQMRGGMNQQLQPWGQYAICTKHEQAIDMFCMSHNKALCQQCVGEHQRQVMSVGNAPSDQMGRHHGVQSATCQLKYTDVAIKESITRMHVSLRSVQEFIKKKESIDQIENQGMRQIYLEQNRIFEMSYNVAHDLLTRIQSMSPAEKVISLEPFNIKFQEKFGQLQNTSQYMEQIIQQMQSQQISGQNRGAIDNMQQAASGGNFFPGQNTEISSYLGQQQNTQEQMMRHHQQAAMHPNQPNSQQDFMYFQKQQQQLQQDQQQHMAGGIVPSNVPVPPMSQQPIYHQQQQAPQAGRPPQQTPPPLQANSEPQPTAPQNTQPVAAQFVGQPNAKFGQGLPQGQQPVTHPGQGPVHPKLPAPSQTGAQFPAGFNQTNQQKPVQNPDVDQGSDLAHVHQQRKIAEQNSRAQGMELETTNKPLGQAPRQPAFTANSVQPQRSSFPASQQPPFVPGYKLKHHQGIQLFVTVEIEDRLLKQSDAANHSSAEPKQPNSAKQIEFEIELDSSWTLKEFSRKVKEDIMRSQLAVKEPSVIEQLLFYNADRQVNAAGQPVVHTFYNELTNVNTPLGEQNIKPGSQIIVTTIQKNPTTGYSATNNGCNGRSPDRSGRGFYGNGDQRGSGYNNGMGSPAANPANGKDSNGTNGQGFKGPGQYGGDPAHPMRPPPLNVKNVTPRPPGTNNSESAGAKKSVSKGAGARPPRELDANGQPIKKARAKRAPKPIEEVSIHFRVRTMAEKLQREAIDAGFPPSAPMSDNEGNNEEDKEEDAEGEEAKKEEKVEGEAEPADEEENKDAKMSTPEGENPEAKNFDKSISVLPKTKLKGIRKAILEELGVQDMCTARLFSVKAAPGSEGSKPETPEGETENAPDVDKKPEEEKKEDEDKDAEGVEPEQEVQVSGEGNEELVGEMASLESLGLQNGGKLEVEVFFNLEVQVQGKGAGYNHKVEVGPEEVMDVIETRVSFFRMFKLRGFQIYAPEIDRIFDNEEMSTILFRDSYLKNGSKLILVEPVKVRYDEDGEPILSDDEDGDDGDDAEGGEDEIMEEEGEEEVDEMAEEGEQEDEDADAKADDAPDGENAAEDEDQDDDEDGEKSAPLGLQVASSKNLISKSAVENNDAQKEEDQEQQHDDEAAAAQEDGEAGADQQQPDGADNNNQE